MGADGNVPPHGSRQGGGDRNTHQDEDDDYVPDDIEEQPSMFADLSVASKSPTQVSPRNPLCVVLVSISLVSWREIPSQAPRVGSATTRQFSVQNLPLYSILGIHHYFHVDSTPNRRIFLFSPLD